MRAGWHPVHFANDQDAPHLPQTAVVLAQWSIVRGKPVRIGAPISRERFRKEIGHNRATVEKYCDCELFFPVDEDTVEAVKGRRTQDRWVCRRMLAMD